jgi:riboflavin kinase
VSANNVIAVITKSAPDAFRFKAFSTWLDPKTRTLKCVFAEACGPDVKSTYKGIVFSGVGEGEFFVNLYAENIKRALGIVPYPGTLNLRIKDDVKSFNDSLRSLRPIVIEPPKVKDVKLGKVLAYPALLNWTVEVYLVRPEITVYKGDVVEVIAEVRLRDLLNLNDGSEVLITIGDP